MSKKKLNVEAITSELAGGASLYFRPVPSPIPDKANVARKEPQNSVLPKSRSAEVRKSVTSKVPKFQSPVVPKSGSSEALDLNDYPIVAFQELARLDIRLTWEQKEYLDRLETAMARNSAGVDRNDPESQRLTKNSVLRSLVEIARQLNLNIDAGSCRNERDLIKAIFDALKKTLSVTSKVPKSGSSEMP